jgi:hypothetical protein
MSRNLLDWCGFHVLRRNRLLIMPLHFSVVPRNGFREGMAGRPPPGGRR